jgi:disulfide bond formation protein DsbB
LFDAMLHAPADPLRSPAYRLGALLLFAAAAVIATALAFQYVGGYTPCPLCLEQRYAYYAGIPALFLALVLIAAEREGIAAALFAVVAVAFLANAALGTYHAGVEWKLWDGPATCAGDAAPLSTNAGDLLKKAAGARVVRCDEAPWRLIGLSFAGWNVVASLLLAIGAAAAAIRGWRTRAGPA